MRRVLGGILAAGLFAAFNAGASAQMMVPAMPNYTGQQMNQGYYSQTTQYPGQYRGGMVRTRSYASGYQGVMSAPTTTTMVTPGTTVVTPGATVTMPPTYRAVSQTRYYTMRPRTAKRRMWGGMKPWRRRAQPAYSY